MIIIKLWNVAGPGLAPAAGRGQVAGRATQWALGPVSGGQGRQCPALQSDCLPTSAPPGGTVAARPRPPRTSTQDPPGSTPAEVAGLLLPRGHLGFSTSNTCELQAKNNSNMGQLNGNFIMPQSRVWAVSFE